MVVGCGHHSQPCWPLGRLRTQKPAFQPHPGKSSHASALVSLSAEPELMPALRGGEGGGGLRLKAPPRKSSTQSPGGGVRRGALGGTSDYAVPGSPPTGHRTGHWARADMEDSSTAAMRLPSPETSFLSRILPTHTTLTTPRPQVILGGYTEA